MIYKSQVRVRLVYWGFCTNFRIVGQLEVPVSIFCIIYTRIAVDKCMFAYALILYGINHKYKSRHTFCQVLYDTWRTGRTGVTPNVFGNPPMYTRHPFGTNFLKLSRKVQHLLATLDPHLYYAIWLCGKNIYIKCKKKL